VPPAPQLPQWYCTEDVSTGKSTQPFDVTVPQGILCHTKVAGV